VEVVFVPLTLNPSAKQIHLVVLQRTHGGIADLAIEVQHEYVVLRGNTETFYAKQLAQETVKKMLPLMKLVNAIKVA
jgi:hypothetical protein